ncbi:prepilin-type N-terminal cleavage/methylation domain-containing protein [Candidatus Fermentibacterales bacterium]|nr:prepilin-type N-terminal cleavage/methylation domain-containing protein [Candidatus Fermentibacterales bacterium]
MTGSSARRGFTLVESVVAAVVILIVLGALAQAARTFFEGQRKLGERQACLTVAWTEISRIEGQGYIPEDGSRTRRETLMGRSYMLVTETRTSEDGSYTDVSARAVSELAESQVELQRRFYR